MPTVLIINWNLGDISFRKWKVDPCHVWMPKYARSCLDPNNSTMATIRNTSTLSAR